MLQAQLSPQSLGSSSSALQGAVRQLGGEQQGAQPQRQRALGSVQTPGPDPFSLQSLQDVGCIFTDGLHEAMLRFSQRYGPVSRFSNPAKPKCRPSGADAAVLNLPPLQLNGASGWLFVNHPDDIAHVCAANTRNYSERYLPDIYSWVTHGKGLLGSQGDYNRRHRKLCGPPFRSADLLRSFGDVVVERSLRVADTFTSQPAPFATNVAIQTQRLTLDCVGLTAFSHDFGEVEAIARDVRGGAPPSASDQDRLLWAVNAFGQILGEVFITPMPLLRLMDKLGFRQLRTLREALEVMRHSMLGVIAQRRASLAERAAAAASGSAGAKGPASPAAGAAAEKAAAVAPQDLLDVLLMATDESGVPMTDEELWEDVHDVMGAGHETTATTAAAALYAVSAHPEVEAKLVAELESVLGGRAPTYDDLEKLPYLAAVVKESLRLYPAIPIFPRCAAAADVLPSGHAVHAGDVVFMSTYALHCSPEVWEDPLRFDPERFLGEREAALHRFQWLPFGAGPRMCLGATFAMMSVSLMVATLLQRCRFRPLRPTTQLIPTAYDITLNFDRTGGLHMEVAPR
ncbi:cytochrome P450 [Chlorella sorokiniana]|uniref:Cytochrome P450 n=1 Tax=Chlorella sorokiniana TaxID=3076 RepID=A0A2P6TH00_CHLSO|nr:cytochrome P450 [Chlorella sorokiniana]|eukprot:PRW33565.1 cytochrome P450 [Chlorella sorokiniana]